VDDGPAFCISEGGMAMGFIPTIEKGVFQFLSEFEQRELDARRATIDRKRTGN